MLTFKPFEVISRTTASAELRIRSGSPYWPSTRAFVYSSRIEAQLELEHIAVRSRQHRCPDHTVHFEDRVRHPAQFLERSGAAHLHISDPLRHVPPAGVEHVAVGLLGRIERGECVVGTVHRAQARTQPVLQ